MSLTDTPLEAPDSRDEPCPAADGAWTPPVTLEDRIAETVGLLNVVTADLVRLIAEALRTDAWQGFGIRSPEHWVTWRCGVSPARARRLVALAAALDALPATAATFQRGALGEDQAMVVARHSDTAHDAEVAELATSLTVPQLQRVLPSVPRDGDPVPGAPDTAASDTAASDTAETADGGGTAERRQVGFGHSDDGSWWCRAQLPSDEGALVQRALEAARDAAFHDRHPDPGSDERTPSPADISWADALTRLAHAGLDTLDRTGHDPAGPRRPPGDRTQVILHLDADRATPPRLHLGPVLPQALADYVSCDATVRYLMVRDGTPVARGRKRRTVDAGLRTIVEHRDGGCRIHGCDARHWLHVHHIVNWTDGGATELRNLVCLCPIHHRMVHRGELTITGDPTRPDGLVVTDQRGRRLGPAHPRPPSVHPADAAREAGLPEPSWRHPAGERLDTRWITWS